jgi:hypothetical protein
MKAKLCILLLCAVSLPLLAGAQQLPKRHVKKANEQTQDWRYEIEPVSVGTPGSVVVKVWSFSKKPEVAAEQARKNAVHGVIFKGIPAKDRMPGKKPLVEGTIGDPGFLESFFADGGDYARYVTLTTNGAIAAGDVLKVSKKEYKVGIVATIAYNELRQYLESKGAAKRLDAGF